MGRAAVRADVGKDPDGMEDRGGVVAPVVGVGQVNGGQGGVDSGAKGAVLVIPLRDEAGGDQRCTHVAVVTAPEAVQRARVLSRNEMSEDQFEQIKAKQMSDADKRARADFVINTAFGFDFARAHVQAITNLLNALEMGHDGNSS